MAASALVVLDALVLLETGRDDLVVVGQGLHCLLHVRVIFQILDGQPAGGIPGPDVLVFPDKMLETVYAGLQFLSVVDVDVAGHGRVVVLVDVYDRVEQPVNALAAAAYGGDHRHAEQMPEGDGVELVPLGLQFVVHVKGHHHTQVHVDDLGGQVEIPLQVGCVHHIDDHIGDILYQILAHVQLFRTVGRQ